MSASLQPYSKYKPSDVSWLGNVPAHWDLVPNRMLMNLQKEVVGSRADDFTLLSLTKQGIIPRDLENVIGKFPSNFDSYQVVEPGDLIFCLFDIDETPRTVGLSRLNGMVTGAYTRFVCSDHNLREFLFLLYLSLDDGKLLKPLYSGLRKVIPKTTFLGAKVALPPVTEQTAIVRYLDHVDERIRRYISGKQKLIRLLEEEKQAVIHQAVTGQVDVCAGQPYKAYKPSGIPWLGHVPAHWEVRRIRNSVDMRVSNVDKHINDNEFPIRLCNYIDVYKNDRITEKVAFMQATATADEIERFRLEQGDVLITKDSEVWNDIGVPTLVEYTAMDLVCGYHLALLRPLKTLLNGAYLFRELQVPGIAYQFHIAANGVTRYGLSHEAIKSALLPLPPLPEQTAIVLYLDKATAEIDAAISRTHRQIELLREYRIRLIADVVTGKLDVRRAAADLPDDSEEVALMYAMEK